MSIIRPTFLALPFLLHACSSGEQSNLPLLPLGNPVLDARMALAAGDTTFLVIDTDSLLLPGLEGTGITLAGEARYRLISRRSLDVSTTRWARQRDSLTVYASAYNRLIFEARTGRT